MSDVQAQTAGVPALVEVLPNHRIDEGRLFSWLRDTAGITAQLGPIRQFQGGQSNPTYFVDAGSRPLVIRKKPPGILLASAHAVEREYQVLKALEGTDVPVPHVLSLCEDNSVIGTPFYVMEHVQGRVFANPGLSSAPAVQRRPIYAQLAQTLAALHRVDWRKAGLASFGRPENFLARQVKRWTQQFSASGLRSQEMVRLGEWLAAHIPAGDADGSLATLVHGDYRIGNVILDSEQPVVRAVLDWELSTVGHPFADLAYCSLAWRLPATLRGIRDSEDEQLPGEQEFRAAYLTASGRPSLDGFEYFVAFSLFRQAAILAGVYRRAVDGIAADARGMEAGDRFQATASIGWQTALKA